MTIDIIFYFLFYFLAIFSVVGYGLFFSSLTKSASTFENYGYAGLVGLFFLTIYSYVSHFFYPHDLLHNTFLLIIGLSLYLYYSIIFKKNSKDKNTFSIFVIFFILFISALIFKTHDDFPYYHFAYSYYLTQSSSYIGIGPFNHGFRTPSSIFYMNSLFYLPIVKHYMFHIPALMIMGFANIILIKKIFYYLKKKDINFITFFSLLSFLFINIFFYRVGEHGTDRSSQILVFILLIEILILTNFSYNLDQKLLNLFILIGLIISLKAFYILYLLFFIPIILFLIKTKDSLILFKIIKNKFFLLLLFFLSLILFTNFFNTGCFLYPVGITCLQDFSWSFDIQLVNQMNDWYEQWSKAGAGPNFRIDNPQEYISYFNWVSNWIDVYFFNKVSDFLLGLLLLITIVFFSFKTKLQYKLKKRNIFTIYIILIILFSEWFYNHPALRYGGYCIIASFFFLTISLFLEKKIDLKNKNLKSKFKVFILLGFIIFFVRNLDRIHNEKEVYGYMPLTKPYYYFDDKYYSIQNEFKKIIQNYEFCNKKIQNKCLKNLSPKVKKLYGKYIFINDQ